MDAPPPAAVATTTPPAIVTPSPAPSLPPLTDLITPPPPLPGRPGILTIASSGRVIGSGQRYLVIVTTTPDVTTLAADASGLHIALYPMGTGRFGVTGETPSIPFYAADRQVTITLTARTADGRTATQTVDVRLTR
jgi:hypothetical protein